MKYLRFLVLAAVILSATALSATAQTKTAAVDMKKLFNGYWKTKSAQNLLEKSKADLRKDLKDMADGLEKAQADYKLLLEQANDPAISAEEREKRKQAAGSKAKEVATNKTALEQYQRQAETTLAEKTQRMSGNLVSEIQKAIADKAKAGGYSAVINSAATEVVVFTDGNIDITEAVLKQLNAGAPIDLTQPAAAGLPTSTISTNLP